MTKANVFVTQDQFLNNIKIKCISVTIFLTSGIKLQGKIISFDTFCIILKRDEKEQLIYKHSISTIVPLINTPI